MTTSDTPYLSAILPLLPPDLTGHVNGLLNVPSASTTLDALIRFVSGGGSSANTPSLDQQNWHEKQQQAARSLDVLTSILNPGNVAKRQREDSGQFDDDPDAQNAIKRLRLEPGVNAPNSSGTPPLNGQQTIPRGTAPTFNPNEDHPLYTLHAVSTTSPVRKKIDITICASTVRFTNPSSHAIETTIPRSALQRSFVLPTRGKPKPHWTVVIISSDTPSRGKGANAATSNQIHPQVIFGLDATTTGPLAVTRYVTPDVSQSPAQTGQTHPKGTSTRPIIQEFLEALGTQILEPTTAVFKSACATPSAGSDANGVPGIEAYLTAKAGTLWFMHEGILWGESKPCEFWAVEDLIGRSEGVRVINATGRNCTVTLTRKSVTAAEEAAEKSKAGAQEDDGEDVGIETSFGPIDGREQDSISQWVKQHRHLFGKRKGVEGYQDEAKEEAETKKLPSNGPLTINTLDDDEDDDDDDFEISSDEDDGGSPSSSSGEDGVSDAEGADDAEEGDDDSSSEDDEGDTEQDEDEEMQDAAELDPKNHPLLQPGAMPKMSKAAVDLAVKMVSEDLMGGGGAESEDEQDELDD